MILADFFTKMKYSTSYDDSITEDRNKMLSVAKLVLQSLALVFPIEGELRTSNFDTVDEQSTYSVNADVQQIDSMSYDKTPLDCMSRPRYERQYSTSITPGVPTTYAVWSLKQVQNQPSASSVLSIVSTSAETSKYVAIKGISGGVFTTERVAVTNVAATSTNAYTTILAISKESTTGTVTVTSNTAAITNISLAPTETVVDYIFVKLYNVPDDAYQIDYSYRAKPWALTNDEDPIMLPEKYSPLFYEMCIAQLLTMQGDPEANKFILLAEDKLNNSINGNILSTENTLEMTWEKDASDLHL